MNVDTGPSQALAALVRDGAAGAESTNSAPARRPRAARVRDVVITVLGVIGMLTLAWLVVAWAFSLSIIVFVTGSMSPSMPTGSAAVVQTVPAADLRVGDVVTVMKEDGVTPVTHRIVAIDPIAARPAARELTLRGDANSFADSTRYVVVEAPRVLVAAPVVGGVMIWAKTPLVMVTLAVALAAAIAWALWPSRTRPEREAGDAVPPTHNKE